jgi:hypothetical protein
MVLRVAADQRLTAVAAGVVGRPPPCTLSCVVLRRSIGARFGSERARLLAGTFWRS